jgi:hypothetical protein
MINMIPCDGLAAFYPQVLSNTPAACSGQSQPLEIDYSLIDLRSNAIESESVDIAVDMTSGNLKKWPEHSEYPETA